MCIRHRGRVIGHAHNRRVLETLDEQTRLVVHRRAQRPPQEGHPFLANPSFDGSEEGCRRLRVVGGFEKTPDAHIIVVALGIISIDDARYSADGLRTATGEKEDALGKLPERVTAGVQEPANLFFEGRHPVGVGGVNSPWQINEVL
jgi:hypothetical protein